MGNHSTTGDHNIFTNCYTRHNYCICTYDHFLDTLQLYLKVKQQATV